MLNLQGAKSFLKKNVRVRENNAMQAHLVRPARNKPNRKRVGRGAASGQGTYSGRGLKGQKSRSGGGVRPGFEGGQNPQIKGLPRLRGFNNKFRKQYEIVSVEKLGLLPDGVTAVTKEVLKQHRMIRKADSLVKILGDGEITRALEVHADTFTRSASSKIQAAGGKVIGGWKE